MDLRLKIIFVILFLTKVGLCQVISSTSEEPTTEATTEESTTEVSTSATTSSTDASTLDPPSDGTTSKRSAAIPSDVSTDATTESTTETPTTTPTITATTTQGPPKAIPAPPPTEIVATVSKESANSESDEFIVTNSECSYFDERCVDGEKPDCTKTRERVPGSPAKPKPCDSESHLECFQSVRHNYEKTCHCRPGTTTNPYDRHRCIPKQNHTRQWGDSCITADDEKCDVEKFLRCVSNDEGKEDSKGRVPSHICVCVQDKFIDVKVVNEEVNMHECYINRTDKYLIASYDSAPRVGDGNGRLNLYLLLIASLIKTLLISNLC